MSFTIITKNSKQTVENKNKIVISSQTGGDCLINSNFDIILTVEFIESGKFAVYNNSPNDRLLFKGQPLPQKLEIEKMCKIMVKDSDDFITIKLFVSILVRMPSVAIFGVQQPQ